MSVVEPERDDKETWQSTDGRGGRALAPLKHAALARGTALETLATPDLYTQEKSSINRKRVGKPAECRRVEDLPAATEPTRVAGFPPLPSCRRCSVERGPGWSIHRRRDKARARRSRPSHGRGLLHLDLPHPRASHHGAAGPRQELEEVVGLPGPRTVSHVLPAESAAHGGGAGPSSRSGSGTSEEASAPGDALVTSPYTHGPGRRDPPG